MPSTHVGLPPQIILPWLWERYGSSVIDRRKIHKKYGRSYSSGVVRAKCSGYLKRVGMALYVITESGKRMAGVK